MKDSVFRNPSSHALGQNAWRSGYCRWIYTSWSARPLKPLSLAFLLVLPSSKRKGVETNIVQVDPPGM